MDSAGPKYDATLAELRHQLEACSTDDERRQVLTNSKITLLVPECQQLFKYVFFIFSNIYIYFSGFVDQMIFQRLICSL